MKCVECYHSNCNLLHRIVGTSLFVCVVYFHKILQLCSTIYFQLLLCMKLQDLSLQELINLAKTMLVNKNAINSNWKVNAHVLYDKLNIFLNIWYVTCFEQQSCALLKGNILVSICSVTYRMRILIFFCLCNAQIHYLHRKLIIFFYINFIIYYLINF